MINFPRAGLRLLSAARLSRCTLRRSGGSALARLSALRLKSTDATTEDLEGPEPPNGFLFNEKPLLPGQKREKEEWENVWYWGMGINLLLVIAIGVFKPNTNTSEWARGKAIERLAEREADSSSTNEEDE